MKLSEIANGPTLKVKAGFLPYVWESGVPVFMFMKSSNPKFGGNLPMIAKGHVDDGESNLRAAIREAEEELGLKPTNIKPGSTRAIWAGQLRGKTENYKMVVYAGEIEDKHDFLKPHYETESVHWMTLDQFKVSGRQNHVSIVARAHSLLMDSK